MEGWSQGYLLHFKVWYLQVIAFIETIYTKYQQILRYLMVGGAAFSVDLISIYTLTEFGNIHYLVSAAIAFILATGINYLLCISMVFKRGRHSTSSEILMIFTVSGIGLLLNELILFFLVKLCFLWYIHAKLVATGTVFFWNYSARKYYVFSR